MKNDAVVPSRLQNILLKYSSNLDLNFEQFLVDVIEQPGVKPVINTVKNSTCDNIASMINKVFSSASMETVPSDFYDDSDDIKIRSEDEEEGVELL